MATTLVVVLAAATGATDSAAAGAAASGPSTKSGLALDLARRTVGDDAATQAVRKKRAAKSFRITGAGYGHGVGMSQYGAYQLARQGKSAAKILQYYYKNTSVEAVKVPRTISVQVFGPEPYAFSGYADRARVTTVSVRKGEWRLVDRDGDIIYPRDGVASRKLSVRFNATGTKVRATVYAGSKKKESFTAREIRFQWTGTESLEGSDAVAVVQGANGTYRHGELVATSIRKRINITNRLALTHYLYGISEMPSLWGTDANRGIAALSAQAITARSYALVRMRVSASAPAGKLRKGCNCHLVDDVRDQNYTGWKKEGEKSANTNVGRLWTSAVDSTVNKDGEQVLLYAGKPIATYYYSSSGGATANVGDVWGGSVPYLRSVPDKASLSAPGNRMKKWKRTVPARTVAAAFGLKSVVSVKVIRRYKSGQVKTLLATSPSGKRVKLTAKSDQFRSRLGSLPSAWISSLKPGY
ncbi:SpoIID/LytB domain-containing protein [Rarobacter incanus]|uniref:SpoIID/LytB domain-containing protein n=1 Tax=Rarobacter incanus TaxID=153494 RepID=UPI00114EE99F|nr:SpoIID/LytB domain-containing protein [Rarobacter incanus]